MSTAETKSTKSIQLASEALNNQRGDVVSAGLGGSNPPAVAHFGSDVSFPRIDQSIEHGNGAQDDTSNNENVSKRVAERCRQATDTSDTLLRICADTLQSQRTALLYTKQFDKSWQSLQRLVEERVQSAEDAELSKALAETSSAHEAVLRMLHVGIERESLLTTTIYSSMKQQARLIDILTPLTALSDSAVEHSRSDRSRAPSSHIPAESHPLAAQYYRARNELIGIEKEIAKYESEQSGSTANISRDADGRHGGTEHLHQGSDSIHAELKQRRQLAEQLAADLWDACEAVGVELEYPLIDQTTFESEHNFGFGTSHAQLASNAADVPTLPTKENTSSMLQAYRSMALNLTPGHMISAEPDTTRIKDRIMSWIGSISHSDDNSAWHDRMTALQDWHKNWQWQRSVAKEPDFQFHSSTRSEGWTNVELLQGDMAGKPLPPISLQGEQVERPGLDERRRRNSDPWVLISRLDYEVATPPSSLRRQQHHFDHG